MVAALFISALSIAAGSAHTKDAAQAAQLLLQLSRPKVVCGLTMKQVDPTIDARMSVKLPHDGVDSKIRRIEPTVCRD